MSGTGGTGGNGRTSGCTSGTGRTGGPGGRARRLWRAGVLAWLVLASLLLAACSSGGGNTSAPPSADGRLTSADAAVQDALSGYRHTVATSCKAAPSAVVCLEKADRDLGAKVHDYANVLAVGRGFTPPVADLTAARNDAQTLANSLEILGDAQPNQANYDHVRNTFDVDAAIGRLHRSVAALDRALG